MKCYYTQATSKWARIRKLAQFWAALVSHNLFSNPPKGKSNTIAYNTTTLCTFSLILAQLTLAYYSFVHDGFTLGMLVPNTQETAPIIHMRKKNQNQQVLYYFDHMRSGWSAARIYAFSIWPVPADFLIAYSSKIGSWA